MRERTAFPKSLVERLPKLKLLITTGMRNASFDMAALKDRGVTVCGTGGPGGGNEDTAELAWGLILGAARRIAEDHAIMRHGGWQTRVGHRVAGKTLGLLGLGRLGSAVARVGLAFGMKAIAWSQNLTAEKAAEQGVERVEKDELFRRSDILSVHLVLSAAQPRSGRRARNRADEAERDPGQHLARPDLSIPTRSSRRSRPGGSPMPGSTSTTRSRCRSIIRCGRRRTSS